MIEKRFTIESERINNTYSVRILKDDEVIFEISNWNSLGEMHKTECEDIVNLLNELYGEMKRFGEHNYKLEQYNLHYLNENTRLKEENKQLKQELAELLAVHTKIVETLDSEFVSKALEDGD